jgi:hypothetical protein
VSPNDLFFKQIAGNLSLRLRPTPKEHVFAKIIRLADVRRSECQPWKIDSYRYWGFHRFSMYSSSREAVGEGGNAENSGCWWLHNDGSNVSTSVPFEQHSLESLTYCFFRLCSVAIYGCFVAEARLGAGGHMSNLQLFGNLTLISHWTYSHSWILGIGISSVKIWVGCFLLRLVQGKWYKVCFY